MHCRETWAYMHDAGHALMYAERCGGRDVACWRVPGQFWGRTKPVKRPSWAGPPPSRLSRATVLTTTGDDQGHSRSSSVSRWRHWIRAWGSGEPATNDPAA